MRRGVVITSEGGDDRGTGVGGYATSCDPATVGGRAGATCRGERRLRTRVPSWRRDRPENIRRWYEIVDELTQHSGLVTSAGVPALGATGPDIAHGGLRLAQGYR